MADLKIERRERWKTKSEYLFACLGYAVGLGNLWRFPYLCYISGGGSFAIPYITMLIFCGMPLLYMELTVGQCVGYGPIESIGRLCPILKGTGAAMVVISFILCTYYNVLISWALHYFFASFKQVLPWTKCPENSTLCFTPMADNSSMKQINQTIPNRITASQAYFDNTVLKISSGLDDMGSLNVQMFFFLILAWVIVFLCLFKGVKVIGKVAYVTVLLPYFLLFVLFIRTMMLPGARTGILFYLLPDWRQLANAKVWLSAAAQIFNSIGIGFGSMIAFASYNDKRNNIFADTLFISILNSLTSFFAGFVVFGALGNMAETLEVPINEVVIGGPELVFVAFSNVLSQLPLPQLWSAMFFLMIVCLGIDSQFAMVEVVVTSIKDFINTKPSFLFMKRWVVAIVCFVCFLLGIPNVMEGGIYFLTLLDYYTAVISLMFIALFEVLATCIIFGAWKLFVMTEVVAKQSPPYLMYICWRRISFLIIFVILVYSIVIFTPPTYGLYNYPTWANFVGWLITFSSILCIPGYAVYKLLKLQLNSITTPFREILIQAFSPNLDYLVPDWSKPGHFQNLSKQVEEEKNNERYSSSNDTDALLHTVEEENVLDNPPPDYSQVVCVED